MNLSQRVKPRTVATLLAGAGLGLEAMCGLRTLWSAHSFQLLPDSRVSTSLALVRPSGHAASPGFAAEWALNDGGLA